MEKHNWEPVHWVGTNYLAPVSCYALDVCNRMNKNNLSNKINLKLLYIMSMKLEV